MTRRHRKSTVKGDGGFELGTRRIQPPESYLGEEYNAPANIRTCQLTYLRSRNLIDDGQYIAGMRFQRYLEAAGEASPRAIDPSKEPVDGGLPYPDRNVTTAEAAKELVNVQKILGDWYYKLVRLVIGYGVSTLSIAKRLNLSDRRHRKLLQEFITSLDVMAVHWGYPSWPAHKRLHVEPPRPRKRKRH